jgi:hypothetical protein
MIAVLIGRLELLICVAGLIVLCMILWLARTGSDKD